MRSMILAACAVLGLAMAGVPQVEAGERSGRTASKNTSAMNASAVKASKASPVASSQRADGARHERQCVIMECGTPWCYNVRIN